MAAASPVYVVLVTGKLKEGQVEQFKLNFAPLAQHVKEHEEGCFTYVLSTEGRSLIASVSMKDTFQRSTWRQFTGNQSLSRPSERRIRTLALSGLRNQWSNTLRPIWAFLPAEA